jgi:MarR family transcriptional regulator for hemolysin
MERGLDPQEVFTRSFANVSRQWKRRLGHLFHDIGLTQARSSVLLELSRQDEATQIELARVLGIEGPTLVRLIDGLERAGLVERHPCASDRRAKRLRLTAAAGPVIAEMNRILAASRTELLEGVSAKELKITTEVLSLIAERLERMNSEQN